jgi:hypothetical protein
VIETHDLKKINDQISSGREINLNGKEPVSMNMWGFTPVLFSYLKTMFKEFLNENDKNLKNEFLIPTVVNDLIQKNKEQVHVLRTSSQWFGVTYQEDKTHVNHQISKLVNAGLYPKKLFL